MPRPEYYHELKKDLELLAVRVNGLEKESEKSGSKLEVFHVKLSELTKELAIVKQQVAEQTKRLEEWDRRLWGLVAVLVGALLSLAAGLIVALARK